MRKRAFLALVLLMLFRLAASTVSSDGSVPSDMLVTVSKALDENTKGRGDLDFDISGYAEDREIFPDGILVSFSLSYGGKSAEVKALADNEKDMKKEVEEEIRGLLYYEELLLAPAPRLDYITRDTLYSFIPDKRYRNGTRLKAVDRDGKTRGLFEVSGVYDGAVTVDPVYLNDPYPGIALRKTGEWVFDVTGGYGFVIDQNRFFFQGSVGRTDLIFPFTPFLTAAYQSDEYSDGIYGGLGVKSKVRLHRIFPSAGFTLVQNGRVGAEVAVLYGVYNGDTEFTACFSVYYEHQALPHFSWKAGYERFSGYNYFMIGMGGTF